MSRSILRKLPTPKFLRGFLPGFLLDKKQKKFLDQYARFKALAANSTRFAIDDKDLYPCLDDATGVTSFDPHYIYHTAWAMRRVRAQAPAVHVDCSSYLYFATLLSAFMKVEFYDYRPANVLLDNLTTGSADLNHLHFADNSLLSLSCMHTVEHIGLGRYGDTMDADGDLKAMAELSRVLAPGGHLYFVVPVGRPRICFNAHRIYSFEQIRECFSGLELVEFSLIPDNAAEVGLLENADPALVARQNYACGCFLFRR